MTEKKPMIVATVEGGVVTDVATNLGQTMAVFVIDHDTDGAEPADLTLIPTRNGKEEVAFVHGLGPASSLNAGLEAALNCHLANVMLSEFVKAAEQIESHWENGDLAKAVRQLMDLTKDCKALAQS
jgi:hypothetical protein